VSLGPVIAGVVGAQKPLYDIWGNTVNVASRMDYTGIPGRIQVPEDCARALRAEKVSCTFREEIQVKGKGLMKVYHVDLDDHGVPVVIDPNDLALAEDREKDLNRNHMSQLKLALEERRYSSSSQNTEEGEGDDGEERKEEGEKTEEGSHGGLLGGNMILRAASRRLRKLSKREKLEETVVAEEKDEEEEEEEADENAITSVKVSPRPSPTVGGHQAMALRMHQRSLVANSPLRRSSLVNPDAKPVIAPIFGRRKLYIEAKSQLCDLITFSAGRAMSNFLPGIQESPGYETAAEDEYEEEERQRKKQLVTVHPLDIHTGQDEDFLTRANTVKSRASDASEREGDVDDDDVNTTVNTIDDFFKAYDSGEEEDSLEMTVLGEKEVNDEEEAQDLDEDAPEEVIEQTLEYDALGNVVAETIVHHQGMSPINSDEDEVDVGSEGFDPNVNRRMSLVSSEADTVILNERRMSTRSGMAITAVVHRRKFSDRSRKSSSGYRDPSLNPANKLLLGPERSLSDIASAVSSEAERSGGGKLLPVIGSISRHTSVSSLHHPYNRRASNSSMSSPALVRAKTLHHRRSISGRLTKHASTVSQPSIGRWESYEEEKSSLMMRRLSTRSITLVVPRSRQLSVAGPPSPARTSSPAVPRIARSKSTNVMLDGRKSGANSVRSRSVVSSSGKRFEVSPVADDGQDPEPSPSSSIGLRIELPSSEEDQPVKVERRVTPFPKMPPSPSGTSSATSDRPESLMRTFFAQSSLEATIDEAMEEQLSNESEANSTEVIEESRKDESRDTAGTTRSGAVMERASLLFTPNYSSHGPASSKQFSRASSAPRTGASSRRISVISEDDSLDMEYLPKDEPLREDAVSLGATMEAEPSVADDQVPASGSLASQEESLPLAEEVQQSQERPILVRQHSTKDYLRHLERQATRGALEEASSRRFDAPSVHPSESGQMAGASSKDPVEQVKDEEKRASNDDSNYESMVDSGGGGGGVGVEAGAHQVLAPPAEDAAFKRDSGYGSKGNLDVGKGSMHSCPLEKVNSFCRICK